MNTRGKDGAAAFQFPDFRLFCVARLNSVFAQAMQNVAVGWFVFELTHSAFALGLTGLFTFLPAVLVTPFTGHIADQFDRRAVVAIAYATAALVATGLFLYALSGLTATWPVYCLVIVLGATKAFGNTALQALMPTLVPREYFANAVAWTSSFQQFSNSAGPATGGLLYFFGAKVVFAVAALGFVIASASTAAIKTRPERSKREKMSLATLTA
ncbi:MAG TPA: MFS transporter, partial [Beijerinckiaceae bacterium]|nr:MFS transporter [Beijerinckiaceae bacterium]